MTWLDWYINDRAESVRTLFRNKGWPLPRTPDGSMNAVTAFADAITMSLLEYSASRTEYEAKEGSAKLAYQSNLLGYCVLPFLNGFVPAARRVDSLVSGPGLGLLLTRDTADMLADAAPPAADPWRQRVFGSRPESAGFGGVYVDIPHDALRVSAGIQVRAILAAPWRGFADEADEGSKVVLTGSILLMIVLTARDSDRPEGLLFAAMDEDARVRMVAMPDASTVGFLNDDPEEPGIRTNASPMELFRLLYERTAGFFRLVLAYHHHGPAEARSQVQVTSPGRYARNGNRPRKGESLFAMTRLGAPADRLGRVPRRSTEAGWVLTSRQEVSSHFKLQPHGPGSTLRRLIWVDGYQRGPEDAPSRPRAVRV